MSNLFEHCRTEISSASQRYEKPEAMQINLLFAEAKYSRYSQSAISLCQSAAGGGCAGRRRWSDAALCMGGCGLPLFGCGRRANLSKLYFSRPPACGIALQKQPNSHFGKHPAPPIGCLLQGADLPPFVTERWRQKCPQSTSVGIGRRCSLSGHKRLRCCGAKDCTASTVAARQSPQEASALAYCPSFCTPAPGARTAVRSVSASGAMWNLRCTARNDDYLLISYFSRSLACRIALRKERKDSYAPLHSVRNDKSCHPQEEVQTNSDTGIAQQTAEKKAGSDRFSAHLPENRKIIRNFAGQSINCRARI